MKIRQLSKNFAIAPQIHPRQIADIVQAGFTTLVNFRPDDESWGQPKNVQIEAAAKEAGLDYVFIPVSMREGISPEQIEKTRQLLSADNGNVLAFCRTGTRVAFVWGLAQKNTLSADQIVAAGANAGVDLEKLRPALD